MGLPTEDSQGVAKGNIAYFELLPAHELFETELSQLGEVRNTVCDFLPDEVTEDRQIVAFGDPLEGERDKAQRKEGETNVPKRILQHFSNRVMIACKNGSSQKKNYAEESHDNAKVGEENFPNRPRRSVRGVLVQ